MARDAVDILEQDHREVRGLLEDMSRGEGDRRVGLHRLARALRVHILVEREVFYPRVLRELRDLGIDTTDLAEDQRREETEVPARMRELAALEGDDAAFAARLGDLAELVLRHAEDVEEGALFPAVRSAMTRRELEELGEEVLDRKMELLEGALAPA
jgi:hemerythrin superfamily protein